MTALASSRISNTVARSTRRRVMTTARSRFMSACQCTTSRWCRPSISSTTTSPSGKSHSASRYRHRPAASFRRLCRVGGARPNFLQRCARSISPRDSAPAATSAIANRRYALWRTRPTVRIAASSRAAEVTRCWTAATTIKHAKRGYGCHAAASRTERAVSVRGSPWERTISFSRSRRDSCMRTPGIGVTREPRWTIRWIS